jgi:ABC-type glycerol-3-phosphate transport system permease component
MKPAVSTDKKRSQLAFKSSRSKLIRLVTSQSLIYIAAVIMLLLSFIPIFLMILLSLKANIQIYGDFWALPDPIMFKNYKIAVNMLIPNMINTMVVVSISTFFVVLLSSVAGYVFARLEFPGKNFIFMLILSLMMIPSILTLTPLFKLIQDLKIINTWWALILPWVASGQVFGILICRTYIAGLPAALFESARMDGATEFTSYFHIALPLAKPIIATLTIMSLMGQYNDFIWPLMAIDNNSKQVITVAIRVFQSATGNVDIGSMVAGFVFATIPLLILFLAGSRLYIEGVTSGAIKG